MASVRMSATLRAQILDNFSAQCKTAYSNNVGLSDFLKSIHQEVNPSNLSTLLDAYSTYQQAIDTFATTLQLTKGNYGWPDISSPSFPVSVSTDLYFVMNTNRPLSENRKQIDHWQIAIKLKSDEDIEPFNYVEGDFALRVSVSEIGTHPSTAWGETNLGLPMFKLPLSRKHWNLPEHYKDQLISLHNPIIISDPKDYEALQLLAEGDVKTALAKQKMTRYLNSLSTLKQFIDNWPGAVDLVPQEFLQRHNKKTPRKTTANTKVNPSTILPDDLKSEITTAIFENKLIGDV